MSGDVHFGRTCSAGPCTAGREHRGIRSHQMVSPPSHCPEGDHLVDGLFSHGCGSRGMEEKELAGAKSHWSLTAVKGGCVVHSVPHSTPPPQTLELSPSESGWYFPPLPEGNGPSLSLSIQHHAAGTSWTHLCQASPSRCLSFSVPCVVFPGFGEDKSVCCSPAHLSAVFLGWREENKPPRGPGPTDTRLQFQVGIAAPPLTGSTWF